MLEHGMLEIFEGTNGEALYGQFDEEMSRNLCRTCDIPHEDLTSEADWMIHVEYLKTFLEMSNDDVISHCWRQVPRALKLSYRVSEIETFVVYGNNDGAVALFSRDASGRFVLNSMYAKGTTKYQELWEIAYPDIHERIVAKVKVYFFSNDSFWYFIGRQTGELYMVTPKIICLLSAFCSDSQLGACGIDDGLNPEEFYEWSRRYPYAHFSPKALKNTDYYQQRLDTPEGILTAALDNFSVECFLEIGDHTPILDYYECSRDVIARVVGR